MHNCVLCKEAPARREGPECRACYKKLWMRENRKKPEITLVSLESHMFLIDKMSYEQWLHTE